MIGTLFFFIYFYFIISKKSLAWRLVIIEKDCSADGIILELGFGIDFQ